MNAKKLFALLLAFVMVFCTLTACTQEAPAPAPAPDAATEQTEAPVKEEAPAPEPTALEKAIEKVVTNGEEVEIVFWTGTGNANYPYLEAMVNAFMEKYPNIKVDFSNQGAITELTEKLTQNIVSKSTFRLMVW